MGSVPPSLVDLSHSLQPLVDYFNDSSNRFVSFRFYHLPDRSELIKEPVRFVKVFSKATLGQTFKLPLSGSA